MTVFDLLKEINNGNFDKLPEKIQVDGDEIWAKDRHRVDYSNIYDEGEYLIETLAKYNYLGDFLKFEVKDADKDEENEEKIHVADLCKMLARGDENLPVKIEINHRVFNLYTVERSQDEIKSLYFDYKTGGNKGLFQTNDFKSVSLNEYLNYEVKIIKK